MRVEYCGHTPSGYELIPPRGYELVVHREYELVPGRGMSSYPPGGMSSYSKTAGPDGRWRLSCGRRATSGGGSDCGASCRTAVEAVLGSRVGLRVAPASPGRRCGGPLGLGLGSSVAPPLALWAHPRGACRRGGGRSRSDSSAHSGTSHCPWGEAVAAGPRSWSVSAF